MAVHVEEAGNVRPLRLLPWPTAEGNPCYLSTEDPHGFLSRLADDMETAQLAIGADMLGHARDVVSEPTTSNRELRFTVARLAECLYDALRVADSRGGRLSVLLPAAEPEESATASTDEPDGESSKAPAEACGVQ